MRGIVAARLFAMLVGCGGDGGDEVDAASEADAAAALGAPASPAPPEPAVLTPCPAGWREVDREGITTCDPWPEPGPADCAPHEAHFVGESGCARIGTACPADGWPADLPSDRPVVFVEPGAVGGDGSRGRPFGRFSEVGRPAPDTIVWLARGTHSSLFRVRDGITVWGACAEDTTLTTTVVSSGIDAVIEVEGADAALRNLRIADAPRPGLLVTGSGRSVAMEDVVVSSVERFGMLVGTGARADLTNVLVRGTRPLTAGLRNGRAMSVQGGEAHVVRSAFEQSREFGVAVGAGTLRMDGVAIRNTESSPIDPTLGDGLRMSADVDTVVTRSVLSGNRDSGIQTDGGSTLRLEDVVVRNTRGRTTTGSNGRGYEGGGRIEIVRTLFEGNRGVGVLVVEEGGMGVLEDAVIRATESTEGEGIRGRGLQAQTGGHVTGQRIALQSNRDIAVMVSSDASAALSDISIVDTLARAVDGGFGRAFEMQDGTTTEVERAVFERTAHSAVHAQDGAVITLSDLVVRDTGLDTESTGGRCINTQDGAHTTLERAVFERCVEGAVVTVAASVDVRDVVVRDTRSRLLDGHLGAAVLLDQGSTGSVTRGLFEGNREATIGVQRAGSRLVLEGVRILQSLPAQCIERGCGQAALGVGIAAFHSGAVEAREFVIDDVTTCGVYLAVDATIDLEAGEVSNAPIGACVQVPGYDIARLSNDVVYRDNGTNLDATSLPVPDAVDTVEGGS